MSRRSLVVPTLWPYALLVLTCACSSPHVAPKAGHAERRVASRAERPSGEQVIPLVIKRDARGGLSRIYVPGYWRHQDVLMELDTGSARSLFHRALSGDARPLGIEMIEVGKQVIILSPRKHAPEPKFQGREVVATLGTDYFMGRVVELDLKRQVMVVGPSDETDLPSTPFDVIQGIAIARINLDGRSTRLMIDTGTRDAILLDARGYLINAPRRK